MNKFIRPTFFKIVITIMLLILVFGGELLYGFNLTITENGTIEQTSLSIKIIKIIGDVVYYPIRVVLSPFNGFKMTPIDIMDNPYVFFISIMSVLLTTLESYLISCVISIFINKYYNKKMKK